MALGYDTMHGLDLGVFPYIVELMQEYLTEKLGVHQAKLRVEEMNRYSTSILINKHLQQKLLV